MPAYDGHDPVTERYIIMRAFPLRAAPRAGDSTVLAPAVGPAATGGTGAEGSAAAVESAVCSSPGVVDAVRALPFNATPKGDATLSAMTASVSASPGPHTSIKRMQTALAQHSACVDAVHRAVGRAIDARADTLPVPVRSIVGACAASAEANTAALVLHLAAQLDRDHPLRGLMSDVSVEALEEMRLAGLSPADSEHHLAFPPSLTTYCLNALVREPAAAAELVRLAHHDADDGGVGLARTVEAAMTAGRPAEVSVAHIPAGEWRFMLKQHPSLLGVLNTGGATASAPDLDGAPTHHSDADFERGGATVYPVPDESWDVCPLRKPLYVAWVNGGSRLFTWNVVDASMGTMLAANTDQRAAAFFSEANNRFFPSFNSKAPSATTSSASTVNGALDDDGKTPVWWTVILPDVSNPRAAFDKGACFAIASAHAARGEGKADAGIEPCEFSARLALSVVCTYIVLCIRARIYTFRYITSTMLGESELMHCA